MYLYFNIAYNKWTVNNLVLFFRGGDSALHMAALHDKTECMKLLLRSGADPVLHNAQDKTPLDIAQERGHSSCEELVSIPLSLTPWTNTQIFKIVINLIIKSLKKNNK